MVGKDLLVVLFLLGRLWGIGIWWEVLVVVWIRFGVLVRIE